MSNRLSKLHNISLLKAPQTTGSSPTIEHQSRSKANSLLSPLNTTVFYFKFQSSKPLSIPSMVNSHNCLSFSESRASWDKLSPKYPFFLFQHNSRKRYHRVRLIFPWTTKCLFRELLRPSALLTQNTHHYFSLLRGPLAKILGLRWLQNNLKFVPIHKK